jgi:hypothetical protein
MHGMAYKQGPLLPTPRLSQNTASIRMLKETMAQAQREATTGLHTRKASLAVLSRLLTRIEPKQQQCWAVPALPEPVLPLLLLLLLLLPGVLCCWAQAGCAVLDADRGS